MRLAPLIASISSLVIGSPARWRRALSTASLFVFRLYLSITIPTNTSSITMFVLPIHQSYTKVFGATSPPSPSMPDGVSGKHRLGSIGRFLDVDIDLVVVERDHPSDLPIKCHLRLEGGAESPDFVAGLRTEASRREGS